MNIKHFTKIMSSDVIEISSYDEASGIKASESGVVESTNKLDKKIPIWKVDARKDSFCSNTMKTVN